ncbi:DUF2381 family protein [Pyxidicoccus xibeiensis]|uniref:DUF2381 family protein n=1 Tax=Pyxidicoccus xibeiensis TaxID=2906759 RepID=UPI0020A83345|nr:DUF2381 family protein [Pyxidicoccus xibeiensis]MCP3142324.1 DUF2381 family protein [Pyxidicoccus xibeiensis]
MRLPAAFLLSLALVMGPSATVAAQSQPPPPEMGVRRIALRAGAAGAEPEIHIRPGVSTVLTFDVKLAREPMGRLQVELERSAAFTRVEPGESVLRLVPSGTLKEGDRLQLAVRFEDGAARTKATFVLVVREDQADRLVEVSRDSRPAESDPPEVREAWAAARQCQDALARVQAAPSGLTALRLSAALDSSGVVVRNHKEVVARWKHDAFVAKQLRTFRADGRVLVELTLRAREPGSRWMARNASLASHRGELLKILSVWQQRPLAPDETSQILVEAEADASLSPESWMLWLSDDGGDRALVVGGIAFADREVSAE